MADIPAPLKASKELSKASLKNLSLAMKAIELYLINSIRSDPNLEYLLQEYRHHISFDFDEYFQDHEAKFEDYIKDHIEMVTLSIKERALDTIITKDINPPDCKFFIVSSYSTIWEEFEKDVNNPEVFNNLTGRFELPFFHERLELPDKAQEYPEVAYMAAINNIIATVISLKNSIAAAPDQEEALLHNYNTFFYELFLEFYRPSKRDDLNIWQTPAPVVNFICKSIDQILSKKFGVTLGDDRVKVFDFCSGTGNFLMETVNHLHRTGLLNKKWLRDNLSGSEFNRVAHRESKRNVSVLVSKLLNEEVTKDDINVVHANTLCLDPKTFATREMRELPPEEIYGNIIKLPPAKKKPKEPEPALFDDDPSTPSLFD